jgi:hypothetical protein
MVTRSGPGLFEAPTIQRDGCKTMVTIFPFADWSYYLLLISIAALSLWIAWRLAGDLPAEKRVAGLPLRVHRS